MLTRDAQDLTRARYTKGLMTGKSNAKLDVRADGHMKWEKFFLKAGRLEKVNQASGRIRFVFLRAACGGEDRGCR